MNTPFETLVKRVAEAFFLNDFDVLGTAKSRTSVVARRVLMWVVWSTWVPRRSYPEIIALFGRKDHRAVWDAVRRIQDEVDRGTPLGLIAKGLTRVSVLPPALRVVAPDRKDGTG